MQIKVLDKELYTLDELLPKTVGSAAIDLKLRSNIEMHSGNKLIGTGLAVAIPEGFVGLVAPRSGAGHKKHFRLGNTLGVIDSDYRGEIMLSHSQSLITFERGESVAQLFVVPIFDWAQATVVDEFSHETARGHAGFGSTDKE